MGPQRESLPSKNKPSSDKRANGQGSIYYVTSKSGKRKIKAAISDINGKRRVRTFKKRSEAEDWIAEQKRARQYGENTYATNPKMTVAEYLNAWVATKYRDEDGGTKRYYSNAIRIHINPALGNIKASNLNTKAIETLLRDMAARNKKKGTLNSVKATLSAAYNDGVRLGDLTRNPVKNIKMPNLQTHSTGPIPKSDYEKLYKLASLNPYDFSRLDIGGSLGLRPGEVRGLKWSDFDFEEKTFRIERQCQRVKGKGLVIKAVKQKKARSLPIPEGTIEILKKHKRNQSLQKAAWADDLDLVFPNNIGRLLDDKADRRWFKQLCKKAGVSSYQLYQLRKYAFTSMSSWADWRTVMEFSGHSKVETLMTSYVHPTSESMKVAVNGIDAFRPQT